MINSIFRLEHKSLHRYWQAKGWELSDWGMTELFVYFMIRRQLFRKFILFRNFGWERVLGEGNTDCQEAGELEVTFRCFIAFWLLEHCQNYNNTTMPNNIQSIQIMIRMSTHCPFWGFEDSLTSQARSLCNVILTILAAQGRQLSSPAEIN